MTVRPRRLLLALATTTCLALTTSACGEGGDETDTAAEPAAEPSTSSTSGSDDGAEEPGASEVDLTAFPVTIENCGKETTYEAPPERVVALDQNVTEMLLALGLEDRIAGFSREHFSKDETVLPEYAATYDQLELLAEKGPSKEVILSVDPDFVFAAFAGSFSEEKGLARDTLEADGISTYVLDDQCDDLDEPVTLDQLYGNFENLGRIFGVEDRADALVESMEATVEAVSDSIEGEEPVSVFVYDSGEDAPFTVGGKGMANAIIEAAGGENIFVDVDDQFADGTWEEVLARDPDVIVIMDYTGGEPVTVEAKQQLLETRLGDGTAMQEGRVTSLPLTGVFLSVRNPTTVETLAEFLHP